MSMLGQEALPVFIYSSKIPRCDVSIYQKNDVLNKGYNSSK